MKLICWLVKITSEPVFLCKSEILKNSVLQVMYQKALVQADCRILWSSLPLEIMCQYLWFLHGDIHQDKLVSETTTFV